jgi:hypothetical protein
MQYEFISWAVHDSTTEHIQLRNNIIQLIKPPGGLPRFHFAISAYTVPEQEAQSFLFVTDGQPTSTLEGP